MRGGSAELAGLFARNDELERLVDAFSERASDHTGSYPFVLVDRLDPWIDDEDGEGEGDDEPLVAGTEICVLSRWDLVVTDPDQLLAAGRAAHIRLQPRETAEDAEFAVPNTGQRPTSSYTRPANPC